MFHFSGHRGGEQGAALHRIVEIIAERVADGFGHDDLRRKMNEGVDRLGTNQVGNELIIADVADDQLCPRRHRSPKSRRKIVENNDILAGIDELQHHVGANIACPARHQDRHAAPRSSANRRVSIRFCDTGS